MEFELDREDYTRDYGHYYIYKRGDRPSPIWYVFVKIDGVLGNKRKSLKTKDKSKALLLANEFYKELQKLGTTKTYSFDKALNEYELTISKDKNDKLKYPKKFWAGENISSLSDRDIEKFVAYRKTPEAYQDNPPPKNATLRKEFGVLNQFFRYAYSHSYTKELLKMPTYVAEKNPRPSFSEHEWSKIVGHLPEWVNESKNKAHIRARIYLQAFILLLGNSGIRPMSEVSELTWNHLKKKIFHKKNEQKFTRFILIVPDGKTGTRPVIPNSGVEKILMDLKKFANPSSDDEFVFSNHDGTPTKSFKKSFAAFLAHYDLLKDEEGKIRSPYSLRHYYCQNAIRSEINIWHLAENAGTSIEMLKLYYVDKNFNDVVNSFSEETVVGGHRSLLDYTE